MSAGGRKPKNFKVCRWTVASAEYNGVHEGPAVDFYGSIYGAGEARRLSAWLLKFAAWAEHQKKRKDRK